MDFMLWAARTMHLFSIIVWLGAVLYQAVVVFPALSGSESLVVGQVRGFLPFLWFSMTTLLVTGIALMLFSPRFLFLEFPDWWSVALGLKQLMFLIMAFLSFGLIRLATRFVQGDPSESDLRPVILKRLRQLNSGIVFFGLVGLMLAASMN